MNPILECKTLSKRFGNTTALDGVNLVLQPGKIVGLLGPNGSGKTTLIKLANGLLRPSYGEILVDGKLPGTETKRVVSYLPDASYLDGGMQVGECLELFSDFYGDFEKDRALDMLGRMQISTAARVRSLSKGTREKLQLILVMSRNAKLYLLDEPIAGVDPAARDYILRTILTNYRQDATVVISTHLITDIEPILDDAVFLSRGRVLVYQPVDVIREEQHKSVDEYFREVFRCFGN